MLAIWRRAKPTLALVRSAFPLQTIGTAAVDRIGLKGHSILVVEDEPMIVLDIVQGLQSAGARVLTAHSLEDGLQLATQSELSAAVLDFGLSDGEGTAPCQCLKQRGVPFIIHTGYTPPPDACGSGIVITKPASAEQLVAAIQGLLSSDAGPESGRFGSNPSQRERPGHRPGQRRSEKRRHASPLRVDPRSRITSAGHNQS